MMDNLLELLKWALPAGFGIWQLLLIRTYKRLNKTKAISDTRDVWQSIAESNNEALLRQNEQIRLLREAVAKLEEAMYRVVSCKHYDTCPARISLQEYKANLQYQRNRQPIRKEKGIRYPRDHPVVKSNIDNPDAEPP